MTPANLQCRVTALPCTLGRDTCGEVCVRIVLRKAIEVQDAAALVIPAPSAYAGLPLPEVWARLRGDYQAAMAELPCRMRTTMPAESPITRIPGRRVLWPRQQRAEHEVAARIARDWRDRQESALTRIPGAWADRHIVLVSVLLAVALSAIATAIAFTGR